MNKGYITRSVLAAGMILLLAGASSCSKGKSYSELLRDEEKATNWYLSGQRVETGIPKDSVLQTGSDAPFYRLDKDGYVYMQVVELGDTSDMADPGDLVYFRFMRRSTSLLPLCTGRCRWCPTLLHCNMVSSSSSVASFGWDDINRITNSPGISLIFCRSCANVSGCSRSFP